MSHCVEYKDGDTCADCSIQVLHFIEPIVDAQLGLAFSVDGLCCVYYTNGTPTLIAYLSWPLWKEAPIYDSG